MNRVIVKKNENYTTVDNTIFKDKRISLKSKGLLCMAMSLPPNWDFTIEGMKAVLKEGATAIRAGIKELEEFGYVSRERVRGEQGDFIGLDYTFYETPHLNNPQVETPHVGNRHVGNRPQLSTDSIKDLKKLSKEDAHEKNLLGEVVPKGNHLFKNSPYFKMEIFKRKLKKEGDLGIDLEYYWHTLNDWSEAKGAKRKDWAAVARQFMRGDSNKKGFGVKMIGGKLNNGGGDDQAAMDFLNMG